MYSPPLTNARRVIALASLVVVASSTACSSSDAGGSSAPSRIETTDYCSLKGHCPNEPAPTSADLAQCHKAQNDPKCGGKFRVALDCVYAKEACLPDGTSDGIANGKACKAELDPWVACFTNQ